VRYVGLDWAFRAARWCALDLGGEIVSEGGSALTGTARAARLRNRVTVGVEDAAALARDGRSRSGAAQGCLVREHERQRSAR